MPTKLHWGQKVLEKDTLKRQRVGGAERRQSVRFSCAWKIKFCDLSAARSFFQPGNCRNLSQSGMKLTAFQPLKRRSIVLLEIDSDLFSVHIKLDPILKISESRILAQVIWRHLNLGTGLFEAGLEFLEEKQRRYYQTDLEKAASV